MPGLLEKALRLNKEILKRTADERKNDSPKPSPGVDEGVSAEEHRELAAEIEKLFVNRNILSAKPPASGKKRDSGVTFLVVVNLLAAAVLAASIAVVGLSRKYGGTGREEGGEASFNTQGLILEEMRKKSEDEIRAREARIAAIRTELENLRRGGASAPGSAEADPRLRDLERELQSLQSDASSRLRELTDGRERQTFLIRQLQSLYRNLNGQIGAGKFAEAIETIAAAEKFLEAGSGGESGNVAALAPALRPVNDLLRKLVGAEQAAADNAAAAGIAGTVGEISRLVGQGDAAYAAGNLPEASALYGRALDTLDAVSRAHGRLRDLAGREHEAAAGRLEAETAALKSSLASLQAQTARRENELAALRESVNRLESESLRTRGEREILAKQAAEGEENLRRLAASVRSGIENLSAEAASLGAGQRTSDPHMQVAELLDTKIALREIAGSESVRAENPGLYRNFDSFFERYGALYARMGGEAAARELIAKVDEVIESLRAAVQRTPSGGAPFY